MIAIFVFHGNPGKHLKIVCGRLLSFKLKLKDVHTQSHADIGGGGGLSKSGRLHLVKNLSI